MGANEELLQKAIDTASFLGGGTLNREQQTTFVNLVKKYSTILGAVRSERLTQASKDIDKLHVSEPITAGATENTPAASSLGRVRTNQVHIDATKYRSNWEITTETLQQNIEQNDFEMTIIDSMAQRIATDIELAAIQGDASLAGTDRLSNLLKVNDGWLVKAQSAHILDAGGATPQAAMFSEALKMMPKQYRKDPGLRFIMSDTTWIDWASRVAQGLVRGGGSTTGDGSFGSGNAAEAAAVMGAGAADRPYGTPIMQAQLMPDDMPLVLPGATPGQYDGFNFGPFAFVTGVNDTFNVTINPGAVAVVVTFAQGVFDLVQVVKTINDAFVAAGAPAFAINNGNDQIRLQTTGTGATASIVTGTGNANATLGFANSTTKAGAASGGTLNEGSVILLTNPKNLIWAILDGTRVFTEFNKDYDRIESVVYNQLDYEIENLDAVVMITNVRRAPAAFV